MESITLTTPGLLFPAVTLLLLAYTNRFLALASLIRSLHARYEDRHEQVVLEQIASLRYRLTLVKYMQAFGVLSILMSVLCMFVLFAGAALLGTLLFGAALILLMVSLLFSVREIQLSINALNIQLSDMESR